ncbi:MAG: MgtC/SapB family protein [Acidobacteria bacterium]|nr:MAG: MgtC/SapB family protein [Acidobacteriota bacterium]REK10634.1 MAG: MgtC/SapB family protein [Acidobacteriota bacterium]
MEALQIPDFAENLGVALGLGLLVGLQRERSGHLIAGLRTFAITALFGATAALLADPLGPWVVAVGMLGVVAVIVMGNRALDPPNPGMTTEVALLAVYLVGALAGIGEKVMAAVVGASCGVLLHLKPTLHRFSDRLTEKDARAIWQFALLSLVILPLLPDRQFGPYDVLNPRNIWLMVVLIVAVSLIGYLIFRIGGARTGAVGGGIIGGLISSTATTFSFGRRVGSDAGMAGLAALALTLANSTSLVRVLVEVAVVTPSRAVQLGIPVAILLASSILGSGWLIARHFRSEVEIEEPSNPTELASALTFGALYALVLVGVAAAKKHFGEGGIYVVATLAGFTDMDAITLSTARLLGKEELAMAAAQKTLITAALANLVFKFVVAVALSRWALLRPLGLAIVPVFVTGGVLLFVL